MAMRSQMFRVPDRQLDASIVWMCGQYTCTDPTTFKGLGNLSHDVVEVITSQSWRCRTLADDWIRWVPRSCNPVADRLANIGMDIGWQTFRRYDDGNIVVTTDGGYRPCTKQASAGWAVFLCMDEHQIQRLIACGAIVLSELGRDSSELSALELGFSF